MKTMYKLAVWSVMALLVVMTSTASAASLGANLSAKIDQPDKNVDHEVDNEGEIEIHTQIKASTSATTSIDQNDDRLPPGIRHAPGITKRIERGKGLPFGLILNLFNHHGTSTPRHGTSTPGTIAPRIVFVNVTNVGTSSVTINWLTNEMTTTTIRYGTSSDLSATSSSLSNGTLAFYHHSTLTGLTADTTYYYQLVISNGSGNTTESAVLSFHTAPITAPDVTPPQIIFVSTVGLKATSTDLAVVTDEKADARVWVSTTTPVDTSGSAAASSTSFTFFHLLTVPNLTASTTYHYAIISRDAAGNASLTSTGTFTTHAL